MSETLCTCGHPWETHETGGMDYYCAADGCHCPAYDEPVDRPAILEAIRKAGETYDATDKLRDIYKELEDRAVAKFCDELLALDEQARSDTRPAIHATSTRLTGLLAAIKKAKEATS